MRNKFRGCDGVAQRATRDVGGVEVEEGSEFAHKGGQTAGVVEMLHVLSAGRLEVEQDGNLTAQLVESIEVEGNTCAARNCDEVDKTIRGTADGLQNNHGVAD